MNIKSRLPVHIALLTAALVFCVPSLQAGIAEGGALDPELNDQIVHNKGNIVTTVNNYGFIGGYSAFGLPSGEWPKNSGQNYLGELYFWMGAVTVAGDTVVLDPFEDFRPISSLVSGTDSYGIRLSTDTTSFDYDPDDTTGYGNGNPAYGWRIWDPDSTAWVYNLNYLPTVDSFYAGGPTALQQSFYRFEDGEGITELGLQMSQSIYQWNYCYNEDIVFVVLEITNTSATDYSSFDFAIYCDIDVGGPDGTGENGRLGDLVGFDQAENLAWTYDEDGYDVGWGPLVRTGYMGTKYLETPDNIGMTAFRTGQWEMVSESDDQEKFELMDSEQFDLSLPPTDQFYIQCTRGIDLTAGKTVRVVFALIAGQDEEEYYNNADMAQTLYDNNFIGPQPPATPALTVQAGDNKVYLNWDDTAEVDIDPLSGVADFRGYKLYRSTNMGYTWGHEIPVNAGACLDKDYLPVAAYQVDSPGDPIQHTMIDSNLTNGREYWYCLVAYDTGDSTLPIESLQNGFGIPGADANVVRVIPRSDPAGAYTAQSTVTHSTVSGGAVSEGVVYAQIFNAAEASGQEYSVVFEETEDQTYWHLINTTSGDTVLIDQTRQSGDAGLYDVGEGVRVVVRNGDRVPAAEVQTGFASPGDTALTMALFYGPMGDAAGYPLGSDKHFRADYEIRFTAGGSVGYWWWDDVTPVSLPFEVWNVTDSVQVVAEILDQNLDGVWDPADYEGLCIINVPYDGSPHPEAFPFSHAWLFILETTAAAATTGDVFTIAGAPVNGADDLYTFRADGVDEDAANAALNDIRVVPDPYLVRASWETSRFERKLQFVNLPDRCLIRVYTLGGDLVKKIEHTDGTGTADWNMLSEDRLGIAPGVYLYHVESDYGNHIGRFAVIK